MSEVLGRRDGRMGRLTLDRPAAFHALTHGMVTAIDGWLTQWEDDDRIGHVLIEATPSRAFCAGGDVRALYDHAQAGRRQAIADFFRDEYRLNARLARYPKPIVAVMDGTTMGGGVGLGSHVRHPIATEQTVVAMPETRIGFVPDVGGSFILSRAPGETGLHLALTAGQIGPADAILCGFADHLVPSAAIEPLVGALAAAEPEALGSLIAAHAADPGPAPLAAARDWIDRAYAGDDLASILDRLRGIGASEPARAADAIAGNAPVPLAVTLRALRRARALPTLEACLVQEFRTSLASTARPDFVEGVRAAVVDKDRRPRWQPSRIADIDPAEVEGHFVPAAGGDLFMA